MSKINYRGRVTLWSENHSPITVHNGGTENLFRLICDFLAGQGITNERLPSCIKGVELDPETKTVVAVVFSPCPIISVSAVSPDEPGLEIQASIPTYTIKGTPTGENVTVQLCDGSESKKVLANTTIKASVLSSLIATSPAVFIKWELVFGNETSPNENNTEQGE